MDKWAQWVTVKRFGGDKKIAEANLEKLGQVRDRILHNAHIIPGNTVIDVGAGDGLLAFGALKLVESTGKVIFVDISQDLLNSCEAFCRDDLKAENTEFIRASAEDLSMIPSDSADAIVARAVHLYVVDKAKCFKQYYRILRKDGSLSIYEPDNSFYAKLIEGKKMYFGLDFEPLGKLGDKVLEYFRYPPDFVNDPMLNYDSRVLYNLVQRAGFRGLSVDNYSSIRSEIKLPPWDIFIKIAMNPTFPTLADVMNDLTPEESKQIEACLKPQVENTKVSQPFAEIYLHGVK